MLTLRLVVALFLLGVASSPALGGQTGSSSDAPMPFEKGTVEISVLGGTSLPVPLFRANADHKLTMVSLQIGRVMTGGSNGNNFQLILDGTPFFQVRQPNAVKGWSVSPLFIRWNFPPSADGVLRVFGEVSGGLLFTAQPVPVRTTTFNFIDQAGFGVRLKESQGRAWLFGYRFQHISNGGRVKPNPGENYNFVYAGISFIP